jgi:hypothetical protein
LSLPLFYYHHSIKIYRNSGFSFYIENLSQNS